MDIILWWACNPQFHINPDAMLYSSGVVSPKIGGGKMLDFRRATVFCLRYRLSKHKTSRYVKNLVGFMAPFILLATPMVCSKQTQELSIVKGRKSWRRKLNGVSLLNDIAVLTDIIWKLQKWAVAACPLFGKIERKCTKLQMQKRQNQSAAGSNH